MRRIDLVAATLEAWQRLNPSQRDQFFEAFVSAALRLDRVAMRDWLRKRLRNRPLAAPIDPAAFAISDRDMALLLKQLPLRADLCVGAATCPVLDGNRTGAKRRE